MIAKIAYRNIRQHKTKTLIIGILITIGIAVLIIGNSLMDTAARGIQRSYIESYTGHVVITGTHRGGLSIVGFETADALDTSVPTIPEYQTVLDYVASRPFVEAVNPQATAMSIVDYGEKRSFTQFFGIDPTYYEAMFPDNIELERGRMLAPGEEGILLSAFIAEQLERGLDVKIEPGDTVLLTGMNQTAGIRIREVPVRGIFRFKQSNPTLDYVSIMDITNVRALAGMNVAPVSAADLTDVEAAILGGIDEDALFGGTDDALFSFGVIEEIEVSTGALDEDALLSSFGAAGDAEAAFFDDSGAWHFLLVKLEDGVNPAAAILDFQRFFEENEIDAMASGWLAGAGSVALLANGTKSVFNVVVLVIAVVAVIIIMNTLVISVTERTTEIGTMRALGAQKKFIRRMIAWETVLTSGIFGVIGIILGVIVLFVLNATGIEAPNVFFEILFGGKVLHPTPSLSAIIMSLVVVVVIGVVASLYPVSIALKTKPAQAMQE